MGLSIGVYGTESFYTKVSTHLLDSDVHRCCPTEKYDVVYLELQHNTAQPLHEAFAMTKSGGSICVQAADKGFAVEEMQLLCLENITESAEYLCGKTASMGELLMLRQKFKEVVLTQTEYSPVPEETLLPDTPQSVLQPLNKKCSNCTCSRSTAVDTQPSNCGRCHLGDAFRCASCPHAGLPAFSPGETVTLDDMFEEFT